MNRIPINDLGRQSAAVSTEIRQAIDRVVASGWYVLGPECAAFEQEFAAFCGVEHCIGVANGTDALELTFRALGIGAGSRVATVANAGFYTSTALALIGADTVFVDVTADNALMDLDALAATIEAVHVDAVVVTHLYGLMHDICRLRELADRAGIVLIEDCAQAHGARRDGRVAGNSGHAACFSFYPTKNLGALGDGGAVVTADADLAKRVAQLRQYGWDSKYSVGMIGGRNSRLDELQAAVLRTKLPYLDGWNARRRDIATRYTKTIVNPRIRCPRIAGLDSVAHLYVVGCDDRDGLRIHMLERNVVCDVHYPIPDHLQPVWGDQYEPPALPVTERLAEQCLTLPCFPELTDFEVARIVEDLNAW